MMERTFTVDRNVIEAYAFASGDTERVHLDEAFARQLGHPTVLGHGGMLFGYVERILAEQLSSTPVSIRLRFAAPVYAGDDVKVILNETGNDEFDIRVIEGASGREIATGHTHVEQGGD